MSFSNHRIDMFNKRQSGVDNNPKSRHEEQLNKLAPAAFSEHLGKTAVLDNLI